MADGIWRLGLRHYVNVRLNALILLLKESPFFSFRLSPTDPKPRPSCADLLSKTQLLLSFAQRRKIDDFIQRHISVELEFCFRLLQHESQTFLGNIPVRTENFPSGIIGSRSMVTLHLAPFHQDPHGTVF